MLRESYCADNMMRRVILIALAGLLHSAHLIADDARFRIALNKFEAVNCSDSASLLMEELLAEQIYAIRFLTLMERQQMELVLHKEGIARDGAFDVLYATRLGRMLAVDKILSGSIVYSGSYAVVIKVFNVADSSVDVIVTREGVSQRDFNRIAKELMTDIEAYYAGKLPRFYNRSISLSGAFFIPYGNLGSGIDYGWGSSIDFMRRISGGSGIMVGTGFWRFSPDEDHVESLSMIPLHLRFCYEGDPGWRLLIRPSVGIGYLFSQKIYDPIRNRSGGPQYDTAYCYNPFASFGCLLQRRVLDRWAFGVELTYMLVFEETMVSRIAGLNANISLKF